MPVLIAKIVIGVGILIAMILLVRFIRRNSVDYRPMREPDVEPDAEKIAAAINAAHGPSSCVARRQGDMVIVENAPLDSATRKRIDDFFAEQRERMAPSLADATDRKTVEKIKAFVDDSISNPRKIETVESGWRPLPMKELRKKVK